jgi:hypothetical protein
MQPNRGGDKAPRGTVSVRGHNWPAMLVKRSCMGIANANRQTTGLAAAALLLLGLSLSACATSTDGSSSLMDARAQAAVAPATSAYPPVEDLPPERKEHAMTPDERLKLKKDLIDARDRQAVAPKAKGPRAEPAKP